MDLYRIINSSLVTKFPNHIEKEGVIYTNAEAEQIALESGDWHPLVISPVPEINEGQVLTKSYALVEGNIILSWNVVNMIPTIDANME